MRASQILDVSRVLFVFVFFTACTSNNFKSGPTQPNPQKKDSEKTGASQESQNRPAQSPTPTPSSTPNVPRQTAQPIPQEQTPPVVIIPQTQPLPSSNPIPETVKPESNSTIQKTDVGHINFNAIVFVNMEKGSHAVDAGNMVVIRDANSKKVIAAGDFTLASVQNAKRINETQSAYPVSQLSAPLSVIDKNAGDSGMALVSICPVSMNERQNGQYTCSSVGNNQVSDAERPVSWQNLSTKYVRNGESIELLNKPSGQGSEVKFGLSFAHPLAMGVVGVNAPQFADASSPLVLDLDLDNQFDLIDVRSPLFDIRFDLFSAELKPKILRTVVSKTGWVGRRDGLLALDLNKNGKIDDGSELFGEYSKKITANKRDEWSLKNFDDGFAALAQYDLNHDGKIDADDAIFSQLRIWQDVNQNGVSDPGELKSLKDFGIAAIYLEKQNLAEKQIYPRVANNEIRWLGHYQTEAGVKGKIADVWFTRQRLHTDSK